MVSVHMLLFGIPACIQSYIVGKLSRVLLLMGRCFLTLLYAMSKLRLRFKNSRFQN